MHTISNVQLFLYIHIISGEAKSQHSRQVDSTDECNLHSKKETTDLLRSRNICLICLKIFILLNNNEKVIIKYAVSLGCITKNAVIFETGLHYAHQDHLQVTASILPQPPECWDTCHYDRLKSYDI